MSERYTRIFSLPENLYTDSSPVVIKAGTLLKDNETGELIAQLKIQNITKKNIQSVKVELITKNHTQNPIGAPIQYEYSDLNATYGMNFGTQSPIMMSSSDTSSYTVRVTEVKFKDGTHWNGGDALWKPESNQPSKDYATSDKGTTNQHQRALNISKDENKKIPTKNLLMILIPCAIVVLAVLSYFVAYPLVARLTGNHMVYINMYNTKDYKFPSTISEIEHNALKECDVLESVVIPGNVESIGEKAFQLCKNLKSVTIEEGVKKIDHRAFWGCENLTTINIPNSVTEIASNAFFNCNNLTTIVIGDNVTYIGSSAFQGCDNLTSVEIGKNVTTIRSRAFGQCEALKSVVIPDSVTEIGAYAFQDCQNLTSVKIGANVTTIDEGAFDSCKNLTSLVIPDSVTKIGDSVFNCCDKLTDIYYSGSESDWYKIDRGYISYNITIHFNYVP